MSVDQGSLVYMSPVENSLSNPALQLNRQVEIQLTGTIQTITGKTQATEVPTLENKSRQIRALGSQYRPKNRASQPQGSSRDTS